MFVARGSLAPRSSYVTPTHHVVILYSTTLGSSQLTSKLWSTHHHRVEEALDESLANLGVDYLDRT